MEINFKKYNPIKSLIRINNIIDESDISFEETEEIPPRCKLTYSNGYYVNCSAIFVDIRSSSRLTEHHYRPKLAKLYRVYISEVAAIMSGNKKCKEINIIGDCVSGIFDVTSSSDVSGTYCTAAQISSLIYHMNCIFEKREIEKIKIGIGISLGKALMIKAGYDGSGINDVVWMGDAVNEASKLCNNANRVEPYYEMMISESIYYKLNQIIKDKFNYNNDFICYQGNPSCRIIKNCINCEKIRSCESIEKCELYFNLIDFFPEE